MIAEMVVRIRDQDAEYDRRHSACMSSLGAAPAGGGHRRIPVAAGFVVPRVSMLIAERNGIRVPLSRSNRRSKSTGLSATVQSPRGNRNAGLLRQRQGHGFPDDRIHLVPLVRKLGNREMPSRSRTEAFGRAPPSENRVPAAAADPRRCRVVMTCSAAESSRGNSISGGIFVGPLSARNGPPSCSAKRNAPAGLVVHHQQVVDFANSTRRLALAFGAPPLGASHQHPPPSIRSGIADGAEQRLVGWRVKWTGAELQGRFKRKALRMRQPCSCHIRRWRSPGPCACAPTTGPRGGACLADRRRQELRGPFIGPPGVLGIFCRGKSDALGEVFLFKLAPHGVVRRLATSERGLQAQGKENRRVFADVDAGIALRFC